ncbi:MAG: EAL domain-containing protein [Ruminococcaceae bacterium]|nr:EAL domain-containing protein [Oscillospiraceae bacterium]
MEYETWDEAFRGQVAAVRQQSVRVAAYTQALFLQACADSFGKNTPGGSDQIRSQYGDLAYKCGLYHQLGKALVPPEYQIWQKDYTEEEVAVYQKYTTDGRALVASLQERGQRAKEKRKGAVEELPTQNIPWLMIRESCEQHMERWNGSGYPHGRQGRQISPIAQIVGLAKELDRLASETKREDPFEDACRTLQEQENTLWSPELIAVLKNARSKCRAVYNKYIHYTMTVPKTIPLVKKTKDRPMGLSYRPMVSDMTGTVVAYEAEPWYGGIANNPGEREGTAEIHDMLVRTGMIADMAFYFLYEAADALVRIENCRLNLRGVLVNMLPGFYTLPTQLQRFEQLFEDQGIDRSKLWITVPEESFRKATKGQKELMARYLRNGVVLVLDGVHPEGMDWEEVKALGLRHVRLAPETGLNPDTAQLMKQLTADGFVLLGGGADTHDLLGWQLACGVSCSSGTVTGLPVSEEEMIRDRLLAE